jgi:hypothetical protein
VTRRHIVNSFLSGRPQRPENTEVLAQNYSSRCTSKLPNSKPNWATRQQAIATKPAKWSAYQIPSVIVASVILVLRFSLQVLFPKATKGLEPVSYRGVLVSTLLHATVYMFLHNLLNVLVQIANKMELQKKMTIIRNYTTACRVINTEYLSYLFLFTVLLKYLSKIFTVLVDNWFQSV